MTRRPLLVALVAGALVACQASAEETPITGSEMAYGSIFLQKESGPVQTVLVPDELYRRVCRSDLGDVRVFNASGADVPYAIRSLSDSIEEIPTELSFPIFPIEGPPLASVDKIEIEVSRSGAGKVIDIRRAREEPGDAVATVAYIVDISKAPRAIRSVRLEWAEGTADFVGQVIVDAGSDLSRWRTISDDVTIANLHYQVERLVRRQIELPPVSHKYLRIRWHSGAIPFRLEGVTVEMIGEYRPPKRRRLSLPGEPVEDQPGLSQFDVGGPVPIDSVSFSLPERNTLVGAELLSAMSVDGPWRRRHSGSLFRVSVDGQEVSNPTWRFKANRDRYFRLRVEQKGGGVGDGVVTMTASWLPEQILFIARGEAPYLIAYGSHRARPSGFSAAELISIVPGKRFDNLPIETGRLGAERELAGEAALVPQPDPFPIGKWSLWAALISGVLLLGVMTSRLLRKLD